MQPCTFIQSKHSRFPQIKPIVLFRVFLIIANLHVKHHSMSHQGVALKMWNLNVSHLPTKLTAKDQDTLLFDVLHESGVRFTMCNIMLESFSTTKYAWWDARFSMDYRKIGDGDRSHQRLVAIHKHKGLYVSPISYCCCVVQPILLYCSTCFYNELPVLPQKSEVSPRPTSLNWMTKPLLQDE